MSKYSKINKSVTNSEISNLIQIIKNLENKIIFEDKEKKNIKEKYDDMNNKNKLLKRENEILKKENKKLREIKDNEIHRLKVIENELKSFLKDSFNKIYEYIDNEYKEKLDNKSEYKLMKKESFNKINYNLKEKDKKISKAEESIKFYGFYNNGNNCYLNSSLQLLTRINELKNGILNYQDNEINKDNDTKGQLFVEFKKIVNTIEKSKNDKLTINPQNLKYIMDYINDSQGDSNEFYFWII